MLQLSRLVWRDAAARHWASLAVVAAPAIYLWREWPPPAIRDALWHLSRPGQLLAALLVLGGYALLTWGPSRQLVASERLVYWRHLPISPLRWRAMHGIHLALLHTPGFLGARYLLEPLGSVWSSAVTVGVALGVLGPIVHRLGHPLTEPRRRASRWPSPGSIRWLALARLLALALVRRRPLAAAAIFGGGLLLAGLGGVAVDHLMAAGDPDAVRTARGFAAVMAALASLSIWHSSPLIGREHWVLDTWGVTEHDESRAFVALAAGFVTGPGVVLAIATRGLSAADMATVLGSAVLVLATAAWFTASVDAAAVAGRCLTKRRASRLLVGLGGLVFIAVAAPVVLLIAGGLARHRAGRTLRAARRARRRFELEGNHDDHE